MAVALVYPESKQGKKDQATSVLNTDVSGSYLKHARFVLRHCRASRRWRWRWLIRFPRKAGEGKTL
jgi:uncharacterized protein with von Willebrand factor type A (vWA) domain